MQVFLQKVVFSYSPLYFISIMKYFLSGRIEILNNSAQNMEEEKIDTTTRRNLGQAAPSSGSGSHGSVRGSREPGRDRRNEKAEESSKRNYDTEEEKKLIEAVMAGKNRGISEIVKDDNLRKIWMSSFFKKTVLTKASVKRIDLNKAIERINLIKDGLSMKNRSVLVLGLGEVLKRKYNLTQDEVENILKTILNPIQKREEEDEKGQERSPGRKKGAKRENIQNKRPFNLFKLLDLQSLYMPVHPTSLNYTSEKSSLSSRLFGQPMSGDDVVIQRNNELNEDLERSLEGFGSGDSNMVRDPNSDPNNNLNFNQDAVGSIGRDMLMDNHQNFNEDGFQIDSGLPMDNMDIFDGQIMQQFMGAGLNFEDSKIQNIQASDIDFPSEAFSNAEEAELRRKIKNYQRFKESLVEDEHTTMELDPEALDSNQASSAREATKLDKRMEKYFAKKKENSSLFRLSDDESYLTPFYSTEDESGNEPHLVETVIKECRNLPLNLESSLHIIKEEAEGVEDFGGFDIGHGQDMIQSDHMGVSDMVDNLDDFIEQEDPNYFKAEQPSEISTELGEDLSKTMKIIDKHLDRSEKITYTSLVEGCPKNTKCSRFLDLLHLKRRDKIDLVQKDSESDMGFGEIVISRPVR